MADLKPLEPTQLYRSVDPDNLSFKRTGELADLDRVIGQDRAMQALSVATGIQRQGFNAYVLAPEGTTREQVVLDYLARQAANAARPPDLCYVFNFDQPNRPRLLHLVAGEGKRFQADMENLVSELRTAIPAIFESDEYRNRVEELQQELNHRQEEAIEEIQKQAEGEDVVLISTPAGFTFVARREGHLVDAEAFKKLPKDERQRISATIEKLQKTLQQVIEQFPAWRKELQENIRQLNADMVLFAVGQRLKELKHAYRDNAEVKAYLDAAQADLGHNVEAFIGKPVNGIGPDQVLNRYRANLLVDNSELAGAPVIMEDLPNVPRLLGRAEHYVREGALFTDFTLIRAGALHRANGGYLVLDARKLLMQPFAWEALKRALFARRLRIESMEQLYSLISTVSLEPEPLALDLKIVLIGERLLYYLLTAYDPEFALLFKVQADFSDDMPRDTESEALYGRLIATIARGHKLRELDAPAVARVLEYASRIAEDTERLTMRMRYVEDLLVEADYWAGVTDAKVIGLAQVQKAIDQQRERASRLHELSIEHTLRGTMRIDTSGRMVGQVNGLAVISLGNYAFGRPSRISATARLGGGRVIDIEREAKLGGAIHSKAVLILSHFLGARYAPERNLALSASIAFEQSYGPVEGDSASIAETCALLSAIAEVPLSQALAVTGSMSQYGQVQAVSGINEKIEGFFEICKRRGFAEGQGVLIPASNMPHLMLNQPVRDAVQSGDFRIYPIEHIDQALALLTDMEAGEADDAGEFPDHSFNQRVRARLLRFATLQREERAERSHDDGPPAAV